MKPWGPCACGGAYEEREVEVRMTVDDEAIVLPSVPQAVCATCGGRIYRADTLWRIEALMRGVPLVVTQ
jgi:YgiT-type zinc finger domain-containing protein